MPSKNMPRNWQPPVPAWQSVWRDTTDPLIAGYFGVQAQTPALLERWAAQAFTSEPAPLALEQGTYVDQRGVTNYLYIAYWRNTDYRRWWEQQAGWWSDAARLTEAAGYWREIIAMPFERFETLHSSETPHGISVSADGADGPILEHGYPGGMRDRIAASEWDDLKAEQSIHARLAAAVSDDGSRVRMTPPPAMCVIRSGQNWSDCGTEEKVWYLEKVHPVLAKGMHFLRDNPAETNCYSLRFVDKTDADWRPLEQSFGLGYATDVYAFENWAKSHPTHLAIFGSFMKMANHFGPELKLRLWHEVTSVTEQGCEFEYINCHPDTGLLGYAEAVKKE